METLNLIAALQDHAQQQPEKIALADRGGTRQTTYAELDRQARRMAAYLQSLSLPPSSFIPIRLPAGAEYLAAEVGIWLAGHAIVPLGEEFPRERVGYIREHCQAPLIIDQEVFQKAMACEGLTGRISRAEKDTAALFYTSGSTGNPKGIVHTFESLEFNMTGQCEAFAFRQEDIFGIGAPMYFIAVVLVYDLLLLGGTVHLYDKETLTDVRKLEEYILRHGITITFISPAVLAQFHSQSPSLRRVLTGSERLAGIGPRSYELMNCYGLTETVAGVLCFPVDKAYENTPIGLPNKNVTASIRDDRGNILPQGEEGELCLEGIFTPGYFREPEKTEELYRGGVLHTGDLARQLPDGNYVYVNRKDWMVKINGQRVEPGEVEAVLKNVPGVGNAIVKGFDSDSGSQYLCAYYIAPDGMTEEYLREELQKTLPSYMVPLYFVRMESFPLNANGKLDRKSLLPPERSSLAAAYEAPTNETEAALCEAFASALGLERVGIDDDFFRLGGDSIRVMAIQQLCPALPLSSKLIYRERTPRLIAAQCVQETSEKLERQEDYPLSQTQMGIYIECMNRPGEAVYNNPRLYRLGAGVDPKKAAAAIEAAIAAHRAVRTRLFLDAEGEPRQRRNEEGSYRQTVENLSEAELAALTPSLVQPFDLLADELFRLRLFKTESALYLFLDFHHIVYDGTSHGVLLNDLNAAYRGEPLEVESWSGFEVAQQEQRLRRTELYTEAESWYIRTFGDLETDSQPLPDRHEEEVRFGSREIDLGLDYERLEAFCRETGVTMNVLTTAAFGYLLGLYTNNPEALFATIYNGRGDLQVSRTIGMLVKTLPVYARWADDTSTRDYLLSVKEQLLTAMNHDLYSFAELTAQSIVTSRVLFAYQGDLSIEDQLFGVVYEDLSAQENATGEPFALQIFRRGNSLKLMAEFHENRYSPGFVERFLECYEQVLGGLLTEKQMSRIAVLPAGQIRELDGFNETEMPYDNTQTVISLFRRQAAQNPGNVAIIFRDREYSYREVDELSDRIAQYILRSDVGRGEVVSILIPRCEYMVIASLGALKARCTYQPLDPTYPPERLNFMVQDSGAKLLITTEELRPVLGEYEGPVVYLNELPGLPGTGQKLEDPAPEDLFTLLYTSGSTGQPKGCKIRHSNLTAFCNWGWRYYDLAPGARVGAYSSYGFDANMQDMYPALTGGATICIIEEEMRLDLPVLSEFLERHRVTHLFMTTQVGRQFALEYPDHPTLKHLGTGGEKLVALEPPTGYRFCNLYGPTECTILTSVYEFTKYEENIPIGKPLSNLKLYVTDRAGRRLSVGAIGELWIAGPQVTYGYLNRPEQTEYAYIPNPFNSDPDYARVYRTGDIVRYLPDGNVEFVGRRDAQVKIRGFRIELTEVEGVVREYPPIKDATVVAYDDPNGGKFIAAYVVSDETVDIAALGDFIRERKPPYMVPAVTMQIDHIPLNQNMKVNKRALPAPELQASTAASAAEDNRPLNLLEQELKEIVGGIVRSSDFGVTADLAYLGLTSISSIKLSTALFKRFGLNIRSKALLNGASILTLENEVIRHWMENPTGAAPAAEPAPAASTPGLAPLSYAQQGVYYDCMKSPGEMTYNIPALLSFPAGTDPEKFARALTEVILAHPYVMTRFEMRGEEVVQIASPHTVEIPRQEMSEAQLDTYKKEFVRPFDLATGPLFRLCVVRTPERVCLLMDFHHLVFDGASFDLFFGEFKRAFEGETLDKESYSYYDYVADEKRAEGTPRYEENRTYFADMLGQCEGASELTADLGGLPENGSLQEWVHPLDDARLERYCREHRTTPAALCLAAAFYTVSRYVNSKQVYLSTISNGRSDVRTASSLGMFVKTLPLGITLAEQSSGEFIAQAGQVLSETVEHEGYPFARISADYGFNPQIVYACQLGVLDEAWTLQGHPVGMEGLELKRAKFKLSIHIEERDGTPAIVLQYNDALYSSTLMESFAVSMASALEHMTDAPGAPVKQVSLLDAARKKVLEKFRDTGEARIGLYHEALQRQALQRPDHMALIASEGSYTYAELNACANRIANALIERGVQARSRVALLLPRTGRVIMSMFGVMKSGSAYIPCDPDYPVDRINHILEDSQAAYVITTADRVADFAPGRALDVEELLKCPSTATPQTDVTPDDLVYLIYTSGSTGKPKGVMLHHAGICNYLTDDPHNRHVHAMVNDAHMYLSVTTVSFDMSLKEIGTTLYNGLTLVLADEVQANNPILLAELFGRTGADIFNATPSRMMQYLELPAFCVALSQCKVVMCGGEKYPDQLLDRLRSITSARIFNTYGPTEITVSSNGKELTSSNVVNIGAPLLNYREFVVDSDGNELPPNVVGELYIGGIGVAKGYLNLEEMTRERFADYQGVRVYKSGDYARWTPQGEIVVLGRSDNQVKLRGLRIELGEVESAIARVEAVRSAVVMIRRIHGGEHLCAYFTADSPIEIEALKEELKKTLAPYMVPTAYLQLESLPLTPNGKTDLKALPEPRLLAGGGVAAANETERKFCEIFARILDLEQVGATDSFFDLGGTSLSVARIIIDSNKAGFPVAYGDVFAHPSPRALAALFPSASSPEAESQPGEADTEITGYDYDSLQPILEANTIEHFLAGEAQPLGDVLLTGASGYLGIHLLHEFLTSGTGKVYCLLRSKGEISAETRLKISLFYYFENSFEELFGERIFIVEGDVTRPETLAQIDGAHISTVINCAANVKHFSEGNDIEAVNVGGVGNLIAFCLDKGARLVHVSTMSVGGLTTAGGPEPVRALNERMFYFGQILDNKYIRSKFLAERLILENIRDKGLNAKIMRVGNLSARHSDGEFQINFSTNSFMGRLKSYRMLGKCPYGQLDTPLEFSPIDETAKAILSLCLSPKACCVFHPYNHHFILLGDIFTEMSNAGFGVQAVEEPEFTQAMTEAEADPVKARTLSSIIAYRNMAHGLAVVPTPKNNTHTMQILYRQGYHWPATSWDYVARFLQSLQGLGFFDE